MRILLQGKTRTDAADAVFSVPREEKTGLSTNKRINRYQDNSNQLDITHHNKYNHLVGAEIDRTKPAVIISITILNSADNILQCFRTGGVSDRAIK